MNNTATTAEIAEEVSRQSFRTAMFNIAAFGTTMLAAGLCSQPVLGVFIGAPLVLAAHVKLGRMEAQQLQREFNVHAGHDQSPQMQKVREAIEDLTRSSWRMVDPRTSPVGTAALATFFMFKPVLAAALLSPIMLANQARKAMNVAQEALGLIHPSLRGPNR